MSPRQSEKLSQHSSSRSASQNLPSYLPGMLLSHQHGLCCSHMHHTQHHTHALVQAALSIACKRSVHSNHRSLSQMASQAHVEAPVKSMKKLTFARAVQGS